MTGIDGVIRTRIDCRERTAQEAMTAVLPVCLEAYVRGLRPVVVVQNLELLPDSVTRLLKALDRLSDELDARIVLEDRSGFADAFHDVLAENSHLLPKA